MKFIIKEMFTFIFTLIVKRLANSYGERLRINRFSWINKRTTLGSNVNFNGMSIQGCGDVIIGDNFHSGTQCMILTQNHNYEGNMIPYDDTYICKKTIIEDNVWIGNRVIMLPGITIGEGAIIQAGAVVTQSIPPYAIVGGNPAKVFSSRDIDHYKTLKSEGKFH